MNRIIQLGKKRFQQYQNLPILALLFVNLLLIPFILPHYGESWDENHQYNHYANNALKAYGTWFREGQSEGQIETSGVAKELHGPSFVMTVEVLTRGISRINANWLETDIRHFLHFITFQIGLFSLYTICRRWLNVWPSLGATLLFMTQPVFWGHGIINPKDMPFAALLLLSISLGLQMYDYIFPSVWNRVSSTWSSLDARARRSIGLAVSIWILSIFVLFAGTKILWALSANIIAHAYAEPGSVIASVISKAAKNLGDVPADVYTQKLYMVFLRARGIYTAASAILIISLINKKFQQGLQLLGIPVLLAGFTLGFITSMRVAGPMAGILIAVYFLANAGRKAFFPVLAYGLIAVTSMYLTWPYLWSDPVGRLIESIQVMSAFPWKQQVLFNGSYYTADAVPNTYLTTLFAIQLTEPVWILFFAGLAAAIHGFVKTRTYGGVLFLLLGWFILPLAVFSIGGFSFYDNFRQVLFILPPVFIMIGIALSKIKNPKWQIAIMVFIILPGIIDGIRLHPYEYIYYNRFIGGVRGAQGRFELDYWATSYREMAEYTNSIAQPNSYIWVEGPKHVFSPFVRNDLKVLDAYDPELLGQKYLIVILARQNLDVLVAPDAETLHTISRDGAVLSVIKQH